LNFSSLTDFLLLIPTVLIVITAHEYAHGAAAYLLGDNTAKRAGRLTLNPIKHIDWIGLILLVTAGFGWAKPVPIHPGYFKNPKRGMALTALAGPAANILLAFAAAFAIALWRPAGLAQSFLTAFFQCNCALAMFNFLPIPPLDGFKIAGAFLPDAWYFRVMRYERYGMILMILLLYTGILTPVLSQGVRNLMVAILRAVSLTGLL
jgi:Zn-dependent protease